MLPHICARTLILLKTNLSRLLETLLTVTNPLYVPELVKLLFVGKELPLRKREQSMLTAEEIA